VSDPRRNRFLSTAAAVAVAGCLASPASPVAPVAGGAPRAFVDSVVTNSLLGLGVAGVAVRNAQLYRQRGVPAVPAAAVMTVFGLRFVAAPLL